MMKKKLSCLFFQAVGFLLLIIILSEPITAWALDPEKTITQYVHDVWQVEDGLPQSTITAILQTRDGYIWLGTQEGLVRFDGVRFTVFDKRNTEDIKDSHILTLFEDHEGSLWIGTYGGGLNRLKDGEFTAYTTKEGLSNDMVWSICEDREGSLWIGTYSGGLNRLKDGEFTAFTTKEGLSNNFARSIYQDIEGSLWIGTGGGGLNRLRDGKFTAFTTKEGLSNDFVRSIYEDREGSLWIGTGGGLNRLRDGKFTAYTTKEGLSNDMVWSIYEDREGSLWIGTYSGGLNRFKDGKFTAFTTKEGLSDDIVKSIYEDREGSLWIGTEGGGLNRLRDGKFTVYTTKEGLSNNFVKSIYEDREGSLWIGTEGGGLNRLRDGKFTVYTTKEGLSSDLVKSIYEDREGSLWIGTGSGLNRLRDGKFTVYTTKEGLSNDMVWSIYEDREGSLWIGTWRGGLNRLKDEKFTVYTTKEGLSNDMVRSIYEDREGSLWIGTDGGGLNRLRDGKFTVYTTREGLSSDLVRSIYEDREGSLWIGTRGGGLNRLKDGKFTAYTTKEGLFDDSVWQILEDGKGNLWMSCNNGIFRISMREINDFAEGKISSINSISYGEPDGMMSKECNGGFQPAGWKSRDGKLWFPTIRGVVMIDPENIRTNKLPPPVLIEQVIIDNISFVASGVIQISPGNKDFEFHYTGLSFLVPERVKFKYKLEGWNKDWIDPGTRRTAYYTNIPPGSYCFRVIACNNDGLWNEEGASLKIIVPPPFWQTWWFRVLLVLLILSAVIFIYKLRTRAILRRNEELNELNTRLEISEEKYRLLAEQSGQIMYDYDILTGKINWSGDIPVITGCTVEEFQEVDISNWEKLIHADDRKFAKELLAEAMKKCSDYQVEYRFKQKDGNYIYVEDNGIFLVDENGKAKKMLGLMKDITRRKKTEEAMEESEKQLQTLIDAMPDFVCFKDGNGHWLKVNDAGIRVFQLEGIDYRGKKDSELAELNSKLRGSFLSCKESDARAWKEGGLIRQEETVPDPDGSVRIYDVTKVPVSHPGGERKGIVVLGHDITERKQAEAELQKHREHLEEMVKERTKELEQKTKTLEKSQKSLALLLEDVNESRAELDISNKKLEAANKELEAFSYSVSHDLRAPLRAIDGFTRILMEDYVANLDTEGKRLGSVIQQNSRKMGQLIDDLLTFSRMARTSMNFSKIDMKNMAKAIYHEATNAEERNRIKFTITDLPKAEGDPNMMRQVWMNLISNALKFSAHRKQTVISVTCRKEENKLTYCIKDNGAGFNMKYKNKLFGVFQRLHSEKEFKGTGVGLALVQRIIRRHGGQVRAEGRVDNGAAFYFSLPKKQL